MVKTSETVWAARGLQKRKVGGRRLFLNSYAAFKIALRSEAETVMGKNRLLG